VGGSWWLVVGGGGAFYPALFNAWARSGQVASWSSSWPGTSNQTSITRRIRSHLQGKKFYGTLLRFPKRQRGLLSYMTAKIKNISIRIPDFM